MKHPFKQLVATLQKLNKSLTRLASSMAQNTPLQKIRTYKQNLQKTLQQNRLFLLWLAFRQTRPRLAALAKWSAILLLITTATLTGLYLALLSGTFGPIPSYAKLRSLRTNQASEVYSADNQLLGLYYHEQRINISPEELPDFIKNALIATEDARFFQHKGIDYKAMLRVFFKTLLFQQEEAGGGSTLSQQLAKNLYPRQRFKFLSLPINKLKEIIIAHRLETIYNKEELLHLYLNTVPFGEDIYGIKLASHRFFDKEPANLQIEEAAVLIGMLKANTTYNPVLHPQQALQRRNVVLNQMNKYGYLNKSEKDSLQQLPLKIAYTGNRNSLAAHFREQVRKQAEEILENIYKQNGQAYDLYTDGLRIYTTIDSRLQTYAEQAVKKQLAIIQKRFQKQWTPPKQLLKKAIQQSERYKKMKAEGKSEKEIAKAFRQKRTMQIYDPVQGKLVSKKISPRDSLIWQLGILHAGFVAMHPQTGALLAYVGDANYEHFQYDYVQTHRQVGSIFKPIVYLAAMQAGINPCNYRLAQRKTYEQYENWTPENAESQYGKWYTFRGALMHSVNTISVELCLETGIERVIKLAYDLGVETDLPKGPAIALGAADLSLMEMITVYGSMANRGRKPQPFYIQRIETADGVEIYQYHPPKQKELFQAINPTDALLITNLLQSVVEQGTAASLRHTYNIKGDWAGKTGTSQNQADGWFLAYSPSMVVGCWIGANSPQVHWPTLYSGQGARTALPVVGAFLRTYQNDQHYRKWHNQKFPQLNEQQQIYLHCQPDVLDSIQYSEIFHGGNFNDWIRWVTDPQHRQEQKIKQKQKRQERQKKRKKFFKDLFKKQ